MIKFRHKLSGFTLVEVIIAIAIIGILTAVITVNYSKSGQQSRDAKRQSDLRSIQSALELYKNKHGQYPEGCNGPNVWSGQLGTSYACSDGTNRYILGNVSDNREFAEFMPQLPIDPKLNGSDSGYVYRTNDNGTVYKLKAHRTVESEDVTFLHEFKPCDIRVGSNATGNLLSGSTDREVIGWCGRVHHSGNSLPAECRSINDSWRISYGVWGGFAPKRPNPPDVCGAVYNCVPAVVQDTTNVICL